MPQYLCSGGPLDGQVVHAREGLTPGQTVTIEVTDVDHLGDAPAPSTYRLDHGPAAGAEGILTYLSDGPA